jgi:hypothetical protein
MKTMWYSAAVLLLVAVTAMAQEENKQPYEWKTSGDTVETFKAEFVLHAKADQSTPEGTINAYALLSDNRTDHAAINQAFYKKGQEVVAKAAKPLYEKLLSVELVKSTEAANADTGKTDDNSYKAGAMTITATSDGEKGAKLVETLQKATYMAEGYDPETGEPTGKMEEQTYETKMRFTLVKGEDGKWRIDRTEQMTKNWEKMDDMGNAPEEWQPTSSVLSWYLNMEEPEKAEEIKQDTPENAALSLWHGLFRQRDSWNRSIFSSGQKGWIEAMKALFTEQGMKAPDDGGEKYEAPSSQREIDKVTDGSEGVKQVRLKPRSEWYGATALHLKKEGDSWKIVKAGYFDMSWNEMGEMVEGEFIEVNNIEELAWR